MLPPHRGPLKTSSSPNVSAELKRPSPHFVLGPELDEGVASGSERGGKKKKQRRAKEHQKSAVFSPGSGPLGSGPAADELTESSENDSPFS